MRQIEVLTEKNKKEYEPSPIPSVAIIGTGQVGTLFSETLQTSPDKPEIRIAGRGQIADVMSWNPHLVLLATPNPVTNVVQEIAFNARQSLSIGLFQNGPKVVEQADSVLENITLPVSLIRGSLYTVVYKDDLTGSIKYDNKRLRVALAMADYRDKTPTLAQTERLFKKAGFDVDASQDYDYRNLEWTKLLTNLIGSTSTVTGLTPYETFTDPLLFKAELSGLKERLAVINKLGVNLLNISWAKTKELQFAANKAPEWLMIALRKFIAKAISAARDNQPSNAARKIETGEIPMEALEHYHLPIVEYGIEFGIPTSVDTTIANFLTYHINGDNKLTWYDKKTRRGRFLEALYRYG